MLFLASKAGLVLPSPGHHGNVSGLCSSWLCRAHRGSLVRASLLGFPLLAQLWGKWPLFCVWLQPCACIPLVSQRQALSGTGEHRKPQAAQGCCFQLIASGTPLSGFLLVKGRVNCVKISLQELVVPPSGGIVNCTQESELFSCQKLPLDSQTSSRSHLQGLYCGFKRRGVKVESAWW